MARVFRGYTKRNPDDDYSGGDRSDKYCGSSGEQKVVDIRVTPSDSTVTVTFTGRFTDGSSSLLYQNVVTV